MRNGLLTMVLFCFFATVFVGAARGQSPGSGAPPGATELHVQPQQPGQAANNITFLDRAVLPASVAGVATVATASAATSFWSNAGMQVLGYILPVIGVLLTALIAWLSQLLAARLKVSIDTSKDSMLRLVIRRAVLAVEEMAAKAAKAGDTMPSPDKLALCKSMVTSQWPGLLPAELDRMINEEIGALPGIGASGSVSPSGAAPIPTP